ncbi:uncharacterized protein DUF2750 [Flavobacterium chryseum]|uniref:DUF2750 domain-containing protein n=1 Tax=Flavobacterium sp. P3160 TaxID=2512113 RepID=UPI00105DA74C|nr:DUF2750 domain-containing protein [Flavobacterium sp. P3160]TDO83243.1 uncharacterized protein DUF2750 [Flavobacterium sp. P3160]
MFKNHIDIKINHEKFIKKVCETNIVYGLKNEAGFATSSSNELEDENGEPVEIICFWSEEVRARVCAKNGWENYCTAEIELSEFIENWCIGIDNDELLVGTNFDQNMFGREIEGYDLILELIDELKKTSKELEFQKFENLQDLETQIKESLE